MLDITTRFVGEEPFSPVTNLYNEAMEKIFSPELSLKIIPRLSVSKEIVSATKVRAAIAENNRELLNLLLPTTSLNYLEEHQLLRGES